MDISRLKKKNLKAWLQLTAGVEVLCRYLNQSELDRIKEQATEVKLDPSSGLRTENRDERKFRSLLGRAVVQNWRGLEDDGADFPCTPDNIDYLMEDYSEFRILVFSVPMSMERMLAAEKEQAEKNSATTSAPEQTTPA